MNLSLSVDYYRRLSEGFPNFLELDPPYPVLPLSEGFHLLPAAPGIIV